MQTLQARAADAFVESIGINTKFGYGSRLYVRAYAEVRRHLESLGVRHVRDVAYGPRQRDKVTKMLDLYREHGIRTLALVDSRRRGRPRLLDPSGIPGLLATVHAHPDVFVAVEGPNEYDHLLRADKNWGENLLNYQKALYEQAETVVVGPSMARGKAWRGAPDLTPYLDKCNTHSYPGGRPPESNIERVVEQMKRLFHGKPLWATETGYLTRAVPGKQPHVSEEAAAKYIPRLFAEYFLRGVERTYLFELMDDAGEGAKRNKFGLIRGDLTPKPAFYALHELIVLLTDRGPAFEPGRLTCDLDAPDDVRTLLLQKRDGTFYLLLWQPADSYRRGDVSVSPKQVRLTFPSPVTVLNANPHVMAEGTVHELTATDAVSVYAIRA